VRRKEAKKIVHWAVIVRKVGAKAFAPDLRDALASVASRSPCCSSVGQRLMRVESAVEACRQRIHPLPKSELRIMNVGATGKAA
jgi:hypothetical protein